jgi:hypothetical protein
MLVTGFNPSPWPKFNPHHYPYPGPEREILSGLPFTLKAQRVTLNAIHPSSVNRQPSTAICQLLDLLFILTNFKWH